MSITKKTELTIQRRFDPVTGRHDINGVTHVLHCHHYLSLYTQLAEDCGMLDGRKLLAEVAEDAFRDVLAASWRDQGHQSIADRLAVGAQYYAFAGMGMLKPCAVGPDHAEFALDCSHLDAGWIKKWGVRPQPVNHFTCGFLAGLLGALFETPPRSWRVHERQSIVAGADRSVFVAVRV